MTPSGSPFPAQPANHTGWLGLLFLRHLVLWRFGFCKREESVCVGGVHWPCVGLSLGTASQPHPWQLWLTRPYFKKVQIGGVEIVPLVLMKAN